MYRFYFLLFFGFNSIFFNVTAQDGKISGTVRSGLVFIENANVSLRSTSFHTHSDSLGSYQLKGFPLGGYTIQVSMPGYISATKHIHIADTSGYIFHFDLEQLDNSLSEVVVTGTLKEVNRLESPVPVEVYTPSFFKKNPTPSIFDALQQVNGVRPQLNCNICNTGDIHINGLEGPYTMVLIDGMPIVSSLSTVYGLSGIPNALVDRIEIVKGPASSLYGSEAVAGLINVITKDAQTAPQLSADLMFTSDKEWNTDLGFKSKAGKKASFLTGINYYKFANVLDHNQDNFTDVTLQDRISIFQKWNFKRKENRLFSMSGRYLYEDRWGGELNWTKKDRGGNEIYGESIYTSRFEWLANYQLPVKEKLFLSLSLSNHNQDSRYGDNSYIAKQNIAFSQLTWDKKIGRHDFLLGSAIRYTYYDDNTPATFSADLNKPINKPEEYVLPGVFIQDEIKLADKHTFLAGFRYDHHSVHGNIFTPRLAYKWSINNNNIIRLNAGTGFRVVNIFTEDHAALTGARDVIIRNELDPEKSYNFNLNYIKKLHPTDDLFIGMDFSVFYTYFDNRIISDYETNPNQIIYDNLAGYAESKGITANFDLTFHNGLKFITGITYQDISSVENKVRTHQILTEKFSGTWAVSYKIRSINLGIDYTGNVYSKMKLPLLSDLDPRSEYSPTWSIQNVQLVYSGFKKLEIYGGVKNLLNFTPNKGTPFLIARANDPFDKNVSFDGNGKVIATADNPYALTFDPNYVYAPNQQRRGFLGIRFNIQ
jgi:outer membrane receptor for ferrienterochelin and colicins